MEASNLRHRPQSHLPLTTSDHNARTDGAPPIKDHLKRKRSNPKQSGVRSLVPTTVVWTVLALYFVLRLSSQLLDYVHDNQRLEERQRIKQQTDGMRLLYEPIPRLPSVNWPVFARWFRPHNAQIVYTARQAIQEFGEDLRRHLTTPDQLWKEPSQYFQQWLHRRAPWLRGDPSSASNWPLSALPTPVPGRAIVISAGDKQLPYVKTLVYTIRAIHQSSIPIRVVFRDDQDLTAQGQNEILKVVDSNIGFVNLSDYFDLNLVGLKGWNLKAFGLLAVAETELVVLDADVMLLQSPEHLFEQQGYKDTGALFYHDRVKPQFYWDVHTLVEWLQPNWNPSIKGLVTYGHSPSTAYYSEQIQEAGLLILDKSRRALGLWAACLLFGRPDIRQYVQTDHMYGDKEVYWMAMETLGEPYAFANTYPGVLGGTVTDFGSFTTHLRVEAPTDQVQSTFSNALATDQALCGRLLHFDDQGSPLWANGGYMLKEDDWFSSEDASLSAINPVYYVDGGITGESFPNPYQPFFRNLLQLYSTLQRDNQVWALYRAMGVECLSPNARNIKMVDQGVADRARKAVQYYFDTKFKK